MSAQFDLPTGYSTANSIPASAALDFGATYDQDNSNYEGEWQTQLSLYALAWKYYKGRIFDQRMRDDPQAYMYPLRINTIKLACRMHALFLWGTGARGNRILDFHVHPERSEFDNGRPNQAEMDRCEAMEVLLRTMLRSNNARTVFREQGRLFHLLGGVFFKFTVDPRNPLGFAFKAMPADYVYPVWDPLDYSHLIRLYVRFPIDARAAASLYGYNAPNDGHALVPYTEQWEEDRFRITIDDQVAYDMRHPERPRLEGTLNLVDPVSGEHVMPWVYVPRLRTGSFYGDSLVPDLVGLQDELNARLADMGDAVTDIAHPSWWGADLNITPDKRTGKVNLRPVAGEIFNAGRTDATTGKSPNIETMGTANLNQGVSSFAEVIEGKIKEQASLSPVVFGEDQGSQRSGETLHARALPTVMATEDYRDSWSEGVARMGYLAILFSLRLGKNGVSPSWLGHEIEPEFSPILPRDVVQQQLGYLQRYQAGGLSLKRWLELSVDVPDVADELKRIIQEKEEELARQRRNTMMLQKQQNDLAMESQAQQAESQQKQAGEQQKFQQEQATGQHKQAQQFKEEDHAQAMKHNEDKHKQQMTLQQERQKTARQRAKGATP